jgi:hypothetical protein
MKTLFTLVIAFMLPLSAFAGSIESAMQTGPRFLYEQPAKPSCNSNSGVIYTKDVAGTATLYYMDDTCTEFVLTAGGGVPTPIFSVWQGITSSGPYDGNDATNYAGADAICATAYPGSHVCWVSEIGYLLANGDDFGSTTASAWVNGGPPGYTANANDCLGWSSAASGSYGRYWDFNAQQGWMRGCNVAGASRLEYACCK